MIYINSTAYSRWFLKKVSLAVWDETCVLSLWPVSTPLVHFSQEESFRHSRKPLTGHPHDSFNMFESYMKHDFGSNSESQLYIFLKDRKLKPYSHGVHARKTEEGHCLCKMIFKARRKKQAKTEQINLDSERHCRQCRWNLWRAHKDLFTGPVMTALPHYFQISNYFQEAILKLSWVF